jgi:hypothetical protein
MSVRGRVAVVAVVAAALAVGLSGCDDGTPPDFLDRCPVPENFDASLVEGAGVTCQAETTTPGLPYGCVVKPTVSGSVCAPGSIRPVWIDCTRRAMAPYLREFDCVNVPQYGVSLCCATGPKAEAEEL